MKTKLCNKCGKEKPIKEFQVNTRNSWCRDCNKAYLKEYRRLNKDTWKGHVRKEFNNSILTDRDMDIEIKNYKPQDAGGLNALSDFSKRFEMLCKLKTFPVVKKEFRSYYQTNYYSEN